MVGVAVIVAAVVRMVMMEVAGRRKNTPKLEEHFVVLIVWVSTEKFLRSAISIKQVGNMEQSETKICFAVHGSKVS